LASITETNISQDTVTTYIKASDDNENIVAFIQQHPIEFQHEFESRFGPPDNVTLFYRSKCIRVQTSADQQQPFFKPQASLIFILHIRYHASWSLLSALLYHMFHIQNPHHNTNALSVMSRTLFPMTPFANTQMPLMLVNLHVSISRKTCAQLHKQLY